jgi:2-isopropylmalate synthase
VNALNRLVAGQERQPLHPQKDPVVLDARPTL